MNNSENDFYNIFRKLFLLGRRCSPRGLEIIEIENFNYTLSPYSRFCNFEKRKLNLGYIKKEFLWYLKGDMYDTSITEHAKMWGNLVNDRGVINSNYGQYIFANRAFYRCANELIKDKDSRRGSITILNNSHLEEEQVKDLPCTYYINFRIRDNKLNMSVGMRSQDAVFGMGNDAPCFSFIHEMMFVYLKDTYKELEYGEYYHSANSFHIYERHFQLLKDLNTIARYNEVVCPKISCKDEVDFLIKHDFSNIPEEFNFTKWLNT